MNDYIKIIEYKPGCYNIKINSSVLSVNKFKELIKEVLNNTYCSYNSCYTAIKYSLRTALNDINNYSSKNTLYKAVKNIVSDLKLIGLSFK